MKFLAILKDSYKEAVSGWVVPVMMVLTFLFVFFVASMSFNQVTFKEDQQAKMEGLTTIMVFDPNSGQPIFWADNVEQTNTAVEPWKGDYTFDITIKLKDAESFEKFRRNSQRMMPSNPLILKFYLMQLSPYLEDVKVDSAKLEMDGVPQNPGKIDDKDKKEDAKERTLRFPVVTHGTNITDKLAWQHTASIFFGAIKIPVIMSQREWILQLQSTLVNDVGSWITVFIGVIITAGFIPNMLRKGALDLFIAKPISRIELLIFKYIGGLVFILLMVTVTTLSVWLIIGLRFDFWETNFLAMIPLLTFYFAVLYAISTCVAVLTKNTLVAILVTIFAWGLFYGVGWGNSRYHQAVEQREKVQKRLQKSGPDSEKTEDEIREDLEGGGRGGGTDATGPGSVTTTAHYMHMFMPRTYDIDKHANRIIAKGILTDKEYKQRKLNKELPDSLAQTIGISAIYIAILLALSCFVFVKRDG